MFLIAFASFTAPRLPAQEQARSPEPAFVLAPGEHDLRTLITAAASYLGRNLLLADGQIQGDPKVELQVGQKLDRDGCFAVVTQFAAMHGLVLVPMDKDRGLWEFINANGPRRHEIYTHAPSLTLDEVRRLKGTRIVVTVALPLQHARATVMAQTLRPFYATSGSTSVNLGTGGTESVLAMTGFVDDILNAATMIAQLDQPSRAKEPSEDAQRLQALEAKVQALEERVRGLEGKGQGKG